MNNIELNNEKLDLLVDQVGRLTEAVTTGFSEMRSISRQQSESIQLLTENTQRQQETTDRLFKIVETLLSR